MKTITVGTRLELIWAQLQRYDEITVQGALSKTVKKEYPKSKEELIERKRKEALLLVIVHPPLVLGDYYILRSGEAFVVLKRLS